MGNQKTERQKFIDQSDRMLLQIITKDLHQMRGIHTIPKKQTSSDVFKARKVVRSVSLTTLTEEESTHSQDWNSLMEIGENRAKAYA